MRAALALVSLLTLVAAATAEASERGGLLLRGGGGVGAVRVEVGDEKQTDTGAVGTLQIGFSGHRVQALLDLQWQPFKANNPLRAQAFTTLHALPSIQAYWGNAYLRGGIGLCRFSYSGADVFVERETNLAYGLSLGYESRGTSFRPGIEAIGRWSHSNDGELGAPHGDSGHRDLVFPIGPSEPP